MPWGKKRLADPAHLRSYGFIVDPEPTAANPDQLPVGFARRFDPELGDDVLDISCAACHTGQLVVDRAGKRTAIRIDGGPASHAFTTTKLGHFVPTLTASLASTYLNPFKFRRFAHKVLGESAYARGQGIAVRRPGRGAGRFRAAGVEGTVQASVPGRGGVRPDGRARRGSATPSSPTSWTAANDAVGNAPVSYPYLWNIWKFDWVQYNASVSQPMARNMGESFGVGARLHLMDRFGRPLPVGRALPHVGAGREPPPHRDDACSGSRLRSGPRTCWARSTGPRPSGAASLFEQHCRHCHGPFEQPAAVKAYQDPLRARRGSAVEDDDRADRGSRHRPHRGHELRLPHGRPDADGPGTGGGRGRGAAHVRRGPTAPRPARRAGRGSGGEEAIPTPSRSRRPRGTRRSASSAPTRAIAGVRMDQVPLGQALSFLGLIVRERYYDDRGFTPEQRACLDGFGSLDLPRDRARVQVAPAGRACGPPGRSCTTGRCPRSTRCSRRTTSVTRDSS